MMKSGKIVLAVKDEYKLKHDRAVEVADNNLARAMENDDFRRITKELSSLNFDVVLKHAKKQDASDELQKIKLLEKERAATLKRMGMRESDFLPKFDCETCNDTGVLSGKFCDCFKKRYYEILCDYLGIGQIRNVTFSDVDFSKVKDAKQRKKLESNYKLFKKYCDKYPSVKYKNALIMGGTGVGKSYLMYAVANEFMKNGFSVLYVSAIKLNSLMLSYHTSFVSERDVYLADVIDCDLLIIDDLGSEQKIKNVTDEYLLKILDEREKADKPVFVTTNLNEEQLKNSYNERVFSRLFNVNKTIISNIDGNDLRLF